MNGASLSADDDLSMNEGLVTQAAFARPVTRSLANHCTDLMPLHRDNECNVPPSENFRA